jgi:hypothetical protein
MMTRKFTRLDLDGKVKMLGDSYECDEEEEDDRRRKIGEEVGGGWGSKEAREEEEEGENEWARSDGGYKIW